MLSVRARVVAGAADVHRCHRHDADHHQVADGHRAHAQASRRVGQDKSKGGAHPSTRSS